MDDITIATLPKSARESVRVQIRESKGHRFVDVRTFASNGVEEVSTAKGGDQAGLAPRDDRGARTGGTDRGRARAVSVSSTPPLLAIAAGRRVRLRKPENSEIRPRNRNAEAQIQAAIVSWIRLVAPELICFHVPNGGLRSKADAARMKWVGVLAGVPDVVVLGLDGRAWLIEVKAPGGTLSPEQIVIRDKCTALRVPFAVAKSIDDVRVAFRLWKIPTRESMR
jgi:VRR-NUC domain